MEQELRAFAAIVETGTFTDAAARVHRTQPAVTAAIRRLESWAGATLFLRGRQGATLTAAGEALLPHARAVLAALDDGRRAVREVQGLERGLIRMGAGATACAYLLPPVLAAFRAAHPGVALRLREGNNDGLLADVDAGRLDLAVVTRTDDVALDHEPFCDDVLVLVAAPGVGFGPVVTFWEGSAVRDLLVRAIPDVAIAMELGSVAAVKAHVIVGVGPALLSRTSVDAELRSGALVEVNHPGVPVRRELVVVHRGRDRLAPAARAMIAALRDARRSDIPSGTARPDTSVHKKR